MGADIRGDVQPFIDEPPERNDSKEKVTIGEAFEILMCEWHVTPDFIMEHWTEALFRLMVRKHNERVNPQPKQETPDEALHRLRIMNAMLGGTETIKEG